MLALDGMLKELLRESVLGSGGCFPGRITQR